MIKLIIAFVITLMGYTIVGTAENVDDIRNKAPAEIELRGWSVMRYEGFTYGSWYKHGGVAWYHVKDMSVKNTYYRVQVSMWGGELQYYYGKPETLSRIDVDLGG